MKRLLLFFVLTHSLSAAPKGPKIINHGAVILESREYAIDMVACLADPNLRIITNDSGYDKDHLSCEYKVSGSKYDAQVVIAPWDRLRPYNYVSKADAENTYYQVNLNSALAGIGEPNPENLLKYQFYVSLSQPKGTLSTPDGIALAAKKLKQAIPSIGIRVLRSQKPVY